MTLHFRGVLSIVMAICLSLLGYFASAQDKSFKVDSLVKEKDEYKLKKANAYGATIKDDALKLIKPDMLSGDLKSTINNATGKVSLLKGKKAVDISSVSVAGRYTNLGSGSDSSLYANNFSGASNYSVDATISLMSIPLQVSLDANSGFYSNYKNGFSDFYKTNFDPQQYQAILQNEILNKIRPETVLKSILSRIDNLRREYEVKMKEEVGKMAGQYKEQFGRQLGIPEEALNLQQTDFSSLKSKLISGDKVSTYRADLEKYQELVKNGKMPDSVNNPLADIKAFEAMDSIYKKIIHWKEKFEDNKLVKELKSHLPFDPSKYKAYLNNPANLKEVIKNNAQLNTVQNFFLNVKKLNLGQNEVDGSELTMQNLMNSGIDGIYQSKSVGVGLIAGSNNNGNTWLQGGLNSFVTNEYSRMSGFSFGSGYGLGSSHTLSFNVFDFSGLPFLQGSKDFRNGYLANARRQDATITYHSSMSFGKHEFQVDISKSLGLFKQQLLEDSSVDNKNAGGSVWGNEGQSNYAAALDYNGEVLNTQVSARVKKVGLGYNNPGNVFLRRGETQLQLGLARRIPKYRLVVDYKLDWRNQHFDPEKKFIYNTLSNKLHAKAKFRKNTWMGFSYQQNRYNSEMPGVVQSNGNGSVFQVDGGYKFQLLHKTITNTAIMNRQNLRLPLAAGSFYDSKAFMFTHTSSVLLGTNTGMLTIMKNSSNNKGYYFNTSFFNTEFNYTWKLAEINITSGLGYYDNSGWNTQLGSRQSVSYNIRKFNIDVGVDYKKALKVIRQELSNQLFFNASIDYKF